MSDALVLINTVLTRGEIEVPRYVDMFVSSDQNDTQDAMTQAEQIKAKFNPLRRAT